MKAVAIDRFGGPEVMRVQTLSVPRLQPSEILVRLITAGVGTWDPLVREGELKFGERSFPLILGNDGAGVVIAKGNAVDRFDVGDKIWACSLEVGFYAEYVVLHEDFAGRVPPKLDPEEAGALGADGITAFRGLQDQLDLKVGQTVMITGASGGVGHIAVQLAKRMGARVLAVASGPDGVEFVQQLGADAAIDGRSADVAERARAFAPGGFDSALILANSDTLAKLPELLKPSGVLAHPNGVEPVPSAPPGVRVTAYDAELGREVFDRINALIGAEPFTVKLWRVYELHDVQRAHAEVKQHHLGKSALRVASA